MVAAGIGDIRLSRTEISSNIALDYVRTMGHGRQSDVLRRAQQLHDPRRHLSGQDLGALIGRRDDLEAIFNVRGIGYLTYQSILKGEGNLVVSIVTLLILIFVVCNLLVDML